MADKTEIRGQVEEETRRRTQLAVPAFAAGFLYLLSAIVDASTRNGGPTVGLFQGIAPALRGEADPRVSPATEEVKYISHHAFALVAGGVLFSVAVVVLMFVLLLLADATRFRRPASWGLARPLVTFGAIFAAVATIADQIIEAVKTHQFAVGHNFSGVAAEHATSGTTTQIALNLGLFAALALGIGMIGISLNAMRVGLLPRWMGILGMVSGVTIFLPVGSELQILLAFWLVMMGVMNARRWPKSAGAQTGGDPPAWAAGESIPWPPRGPARAPRTAAAGANGGALGDVAPAPVAPAGKGSSGRRRRKRGPGSRN